MEFYTVSLFGHRKIEDLFRLEELLVPVIKDLMQTKEYITFLIGRNGEFDEFAASVIKSLQKKIRKDNNDMTLVLPYPVANLEYYEQYYDSVMIPEIMHGVYPKFAITLKNRWMIDRSDIVVVYSEHEKGGSYAALKYAEKQNKRVVHLLTSAL